MLNSRNHFLKQNFKILLMKSFFKTLLASTLGVIIGLILVFLIFVGIISAIISSTEEKVEVKANSILKLTLDKQIVEREENNPLEDLNFDGFGGEKKEGITEIVENIKKAKNDKNISGIYLELTYIQARPAAIEEIRNSLLDFKESKKFIVAYADYLSESAYYLATAADKIYLNPQGSIDFTGMRSELMFFKGTFEKLGIEVQIIRHGKFKGAVEPFMLEKMSPENREQIQTYVGSIWKHTLDGISQSRNLSVEHLKRLANTMVLSDADSCLANKIVDSLIYKDQLLELLVKMSGTSEKKPELIGHSNYKKAPQDREGKSLAKNKIAVVYAYGDVVMGKAGEGSISSDRISKAIRDARTDSSIRAIVLRVNSPGGSALASEIIWREVSLASKEKPVIVSMGELAASGGYYISCAANKIVAQPNTITGSIGVFGLMLNTKSFLKDKLGITTDVVKTNEHSDFPSFTRSMDNYEKNYLQMEVDKIYETFVAHVAEGRNLDKVKVDEIGQGRVWSGIDALKHGLVDTLGNLTDAVKMAARMSDLGDDYRVVRLPKLEDPFDALFKNTVDEVRSRTIKNELGNNAKYYQMYQTVINMKGVQARLPYEIEVY